MGWWTRKCTKWWNVNQKKLLVVWNWALWSLKLVPWNNHQSGSASCKEVFSFNHEDEPFYNWLNQSGPKNLKCKKHVKVSTTSLLHLQSQFHHWFSIWLAIGSFAQSNIPQIQANQLFNVKALICNQTATNSKSTLNQAIQTVSCQN